MQAEKHASALRSSKPEGDSRAGQRFGAAPSMSKSAAAPTSAKVKPSVAWAALSASNGAPPARQPSAQGKPADPQRLSLTAQGMLSSCSSFSWSDRRARLDSLASATMAVEYAVTARSIAVCQLQY